MKELLALELSSDASPKKEYSKKLTLLRNKGDHEHNLRVKASEEGLIIVAQRYHETLNLKDYVPCPSCLMWVKASAMKKHAKRCPILTTDTNTNMSKYVRCMKKMGLKLLGESSLDQDVLNDILASMNKDETATCAQNDFLIRELGLEWYNKSHRNKLRRKNYASEHMRRIAKLLLCCHEQNSKIHNVDDLLQPCNFDITLDATIHLSTDTDGNFKHLSIPIKIGRDLEMMCESKEIVAIQKGNKTSEIEATSYLKVLRKRWNNRIAIRTRCVAEERKYNKSDELPPPSDIQVFSDYLKNEIAKFNANCEDPDWETYRRAAILCQCRLATFNKRRPGELEALTLETYRLKAQGNVDVLHDDIIATLSSVEKKLVNNTDIVYIRGKRGSKVPLLIPHAMKTILHYVAHDKVRDAVGVGNSCDTEGHHYLFANSGKVFILKM